MFKKKTNNSPQGTLANLWRKILRDRELDKAINYLVTRYVDKNSGSSERLKKKTRAAITADITAPDLSWKKFTNLVFNYLGCVRMDISVKLTFANGESSVHTVGIKPAVEVKEIDNEVSK